MSRTGKLASLASVAAAAAITVAATATPALAWTAGDFTATLDGTMVIDAGIPAECTGSTLSGSIDADGNLTITDASVSGCGVTVTPQNLPWSGSLDGGVATLSGFSMSAVGCTFGGTLTGSFTGTDLPVTAQFVEQTVNRTSGFLCPGSATVTATYDFNPA